jgi:MYXO-CTERM domain-containing protein
VNIDETDPLNPVDDVGFDFDSDGLENDREPNMGLDPANPDTDFDGLCDGNVGLDSGACAFGEDLDTDGIVDAGESDPRLPDTDGGGVDDGTEHLADGSDFRNPDDDDPDRDRLTNLEERLAATDPRDADTDDDGLLDGEEVAFETDPLNRDTDGDLLLDGTEAGARRPHADTDPARFVADSDPQTHTDPLNPDTDGGGIIDGLEDIDRDGAIGGDETDPRNGSDDRLEGCLSRRDCDGDRLPDTFEQTIGTDPRNRDSDGDGIDDGTEVLRLPALDPLNGDSDEDGLCDGSTDVEPVCVGGEDLNLDGFIDQGETDPAEGDSDFGGVPDGVEVRRGTDPLDPTDDVAADDGCGCSSSEGDATWSLALLALLALRRRRALATA